MKQLLHKYWAILLLVVSGFAIYGGSLQNHFLLDDESQILNNNLIHDPTNIKVFFSGATMHSESNTLAGIYYKPIMSTLYSVMWWANPGDPTLFHLLQLLLAISNAILFYLFLRRFISEMAAAMIAWIFLVHPINSEVVVYIADLQDVLYTFFGLLAMNLLASRRELSLKASAGFAFLLFCGLLSKESGVLYVVLGLVYAAAFLRRSLVRIIPCVGVSIAVYLYLRIGVAHLSSLSYGMNQIGRASAFTRLLTSPLVMFSYYWKFVFPRDITATQDWVIHEATMQNVWLPLAALLLILTASVWYAFREWKHGRTVFAFFTFWTFMGTGFHSHIVAPLDGTVADRWFYFTCAGLLAMLAMLFDKYYTRAPRVALLVVAVTVMAFSARSWERSHDWFDNYVLCFHDLQVFPDSYDMHNNLGVELFRRGNIPAAKEEFEKSVSLTPIWDVNWNNLGAAYSALGDPQKAEAAYARSINNGTYYLAYENYAKLLVAEKRFSEARKFITEQALPRFPASRTLREALGEIH